MPLSLVPEAVAPSAAYPTPRAAFAATVGAYHTLDDPEMGWLTFVANEDPEIFIQYVAGVINLGLRPLDLRQILSSAGAPEVARRLKCGRQGDFTQWFIHPPDAPVMAQVLDAAFRAMGLGPDYRVRATFEMGGPPGPLSRSLWGSTLVGWVLLVASLGASALVAVLVGPWALARLGRSVPLFVVFLAVPGLLASVAVYLGGRHLLRRAGITVHHGDPPAGPPA